MSFRKTVFPLLLTAVLLTGCAEFYTSEYSVVRDHNAPYSVKPETNGSSAEADEPLSASNYYQLSKTVRQMIESGIEHWIVRVTSDYSDDSGSLESDLRSLSEYVKNDYPVGAYAVDYFTYGTVSENRETRISFDVVYRRSAGEIRSIAKVLHNDRAKEKIYAAIQSFGASLTLQISGYAEEDFAAVIDDYLLRNPSVNSLSPECSVQIYPDSGSVRIAEIHFTYSDLSKDGLSGKQQEADFALQRLNNNLDYSAPDEVFMNSLIRYLSSNYDISFDENASAYDFLCNNLLSSRAASSVFSEFCTKKGIENVIVKGSLFSAPYYWVIVRLNGVFYHVDVTDCIGSQRRALRLLSDSEMLPCLWNTDLYPNCGFYMGGGVSSDFAEGADLAQ